MIFKKSLLISVLLIEVLVGCNQRPSQSQTNLAKRMSAFSGGVIKESGEPIAHIIAWSEYARVVFVFIPSVERYSAINLDTGQYEIYGVDGGTSFYFTSNDCSGTPIAVNNHVGERNKAVVYLPLSDTYYLVTGTKASITYSSSYSRHTIPFCDSDPGSTSRSFAISPTNQPYDFSTHAPLTVSYD